MIIDANNPRRYDIPPRDPGDRGRQQAPPPERPVPMGSDCGLDLADGSVARASLRGGGLLLRPFIDYRPNGGKTGSELSRINRAHADAKAGLALNAEHAERQRLSLKLQRRWRKVRDGHIGGRVPTYAAEIAERLRLRALRHGEAARQCGRIIVDCHDALVATEPNSVPMLLRRDAIRRLRSQHAERWGAHIRTARAAAALLLRLEALR